MKKNIFGLFLAVLPVCSLVSHGGALSDPPCPSPPRHVANNGIYFELGGGSIYSGIGYSGVINAAFFSHLAFTTGYVFETVPIDEVRYRGLSAALEWHETFYENSKFFWTFGCAYANIHDASQLNNESVLDAEKQHYVAPMIGLEMLLWHRFSTELRFQPHYFNSGSGSAFRPWFGFKTKIQFGWTRDGQLIGVYR